MTVDEYFAYLKIMMHTRAQIAELERQYFWQQSLLELRKELHEKRPSSGA